MKKHDVIIIGGGVTGATIARELSKYRLKTALVEKEEELSFGVSKSNSGIIHSAAGMSMNLLKGRLCVEGNRLMPSLSRELAVDFKEVGAIMVAFNSGELERLREIQNNCRKVGIIGTEIVNKKWLAENEPNLNPDISHCLYTPSAGILSPYRLVYALAENAAENGIEIFTSRKVLRISRRAGSFYVVTSKETFISTCIVNAAGLYADQVSKMAGLNYFTILPRKGEEYILDKKKENMVNHLIFPLPHAKTKGTLIIKTADGNPMIGPSAEETGDKQDLSTSDAGLDRVLKNAQKLMPWIKKEDIIAYFAGLRPVVEEDFIIKHEDNLPGFINVAGIQSPGLTAAPAIAKMVKNLIEKNCFRLEKKKIFRKYRKKNVHLFAIPLSKTKNLIKREPAYGDIVCRCELVSAMEIREAVKQGAGTLDGVKFRTRAGAGRCHGSFCTIRVMKILSKELGMPLEKITKRGKGTEIIIR